MEKCDRCSHKGNRFDDNGEQMFFSQETFCREKGKDVFGGYFMYDIDEEYFDDWEVVEDYRC
jgi:hypothetical protein